MIAVGKLVGMVSDILNGGYDITFHVNDLPNLDGIDKDTVLTISAKKKRNKRSLDANAYAWVLMSQIGDVLHIPKEDVYLDELAKYGQHAFLMRVEHGTKVDAVGLHYIFLEYNGEHDIYEVFRGSSTYDTKEMADFIDGIVSDAEELGIDTVPRMELERIKEKWHL